MKLEFDRLSNQRVYKLVAGDLYGDFSWALVEEIAEETWRLSFGQIGSDNVYMGSSALPAAGREAGRLIEVESARGVVADAVSLSAGLVGYKSIGDVTTRI